MLKNVFPVDDLRSLARRRMSPLEFKSVPAGSLSDLPPDEGWQVHRQGKSAVRLSRPKATSVSLEDSVWCLLYRLGFTHLSGDGGAQLELDENSNSVDGQLPALVTGASGHIGANLVRALLGQGRRVRALVHRQTKGVDGLP